MKERRTGLKPLEAYFKRQGAELEVVYLENTDLPLGVEARFPYGSWVYLLEPPKTLHIVRFKQNDRAAKGLGSFLKKMMATLRPLPEVLPDLERIVGVVFRDPQEGDRGPTRWVRSFEKEGARWEVIDSSGLPALVYYFPKKG